MRNWFAVFLFCEAKPGTVLLRFESDSRVNWIQFMEGSALLIVSKECYCSDVLWKCGEWLCDAEVQDLESNTA